MTRILVTSTVLASVLLACASHTPPGDGSEDPARSKVAAASSVLVTPLPPEASARPLCAKDANDVFVGVTDHAVACDKDLKNCAARVPVAVINCTDTAILLEEVKLTAIDGFRMGFIYEPKEVGADRAEVREVSFRWAERFEVEARGWRSAVSRERGEAAVLLARGTLNVTNPALDAAQARCRACEGIWGPVGMMGTETCNCKTTDSGRQCDDGDDCEGTCLYDRMEIVVEPKAPWCDAHGCYVTRGLGRPLGKCSERRLVFGCKARIERGASSKPPLTLPTLILHSCVD